MWMLLPVCCLAILHMAGNNLGVVPDLAGIIGNKVIYVSTVYTYIVFGVIMAAIIAWIGVRSGQELVVIIKDLYGIRGKKVLALTILSICVPASALTGGFYAGRILQMVTEIPHDFATLLCFILFSTLAAGHGHWLLILSNYIGGLLVPFIIIILFFHDFTIEFITPSLGSINWLLVLGLLSYSVGGMWSILVTETSAYLSQKGYKAILLVIVAKFIEGIFTLFSAYLVLAADISGPLSLVMLVSKVSGPTMECLFNVILFCTFMNTMVPAMLVNARQVSILIGLTFFPALLLASIAVYAISWINFTTMLSIMGYAGMLMILFIVSTAYFLHKDRINQQ